MYAILCPLKSELEAVKKSMEGHSCVIALGGHGKVNYAIRTTELILQNPNLETIVCLGAGGGVTKSVNPLDVVIATKSIEHDYWEKFNPKGSLPQVRGSKALVDKAQQFSGKDFRVHLGPVASGDEDIVSSERATEIFERTQALAVGWEGMGGAKACRTYQKSFLEIRGITDVCTSESNLDFKKNLEKAIQNACEVLKFIMN